MAITLDASSTPAGQVGAINFAHTAAGTVRGVVCTIAQSIGFTDEVTSVTWAGVPMTRVAAIFKGTGETGAVYVYFLGSDVATGLQNCVITVNGTGSNKRCAFWSLNAAADLAVKTFDTTINSDSVANPSVTLALGGLSCWCNIVFLSGQDDPLNVTPLANWTGTGEDTLGSLGECGGHYRYNTIGTVDVLAGWTQAAEDAAAIAFALTEQTYIGKVTRVAHCTNVVDEH